jgi:selenocysteine-specific elongation factor
MIAGATGMELVMLVVAADEGVMPQTREHVAVCELLGIDRAVIVITKTDAVDADLAQVAAEEARALLGDRWRADVVRCSARTGEGVEAVRSVLRGALAGLPSPHGPRVMRLGVDRVFTVRGAGTVVTGTLVSGHVGAGDPLFVVGERGVRESSARALHIHDATVAQAEAPTRLAVNLAGVALDEVRRGDVVTTDATLRATTLFDVLLRPGHALSRGAAVTVHVGTASTPARVDAVDTAGAGAVARMRLARATALAGGDRVVLRGGVDGPSGAVVGGGIVVDARPDRRASGAKRRTVLAALSTLDAEVTARALVDAAAPRPLERASLPGRFALDGSALARAADRAVHAGAAARVGDHGWIARPRLDALVGRARELVRSHHQRAPLERGLPLETLRARLATGGGRLVAEEAIRVATGGRDAPDRLVIDGDVVRMPGSTAAAAGEATALMSAVADALREAGIAGATEHTLADRTGSAPSGLRAALQRLGRDAAAVRLGEIWFASAVVDEARRRLVEHFAATRTLSVVEFKERTGMARKQAVLMLEHFDRLGLTRREGDARVAR